MNDHCAFCGFNGHTFTAHTSELSDKERSVLSGEYRRRDYIEMSICWVCFGKKVVPCGSPTCTVKGCGGPCPQCCQGKR